MSRAGSTKLWNNTGYRKEVYQVHWCPLSCSLVFFHKCILLIIYFKLVIFNCDIIISNTFTIIIKFPIPCYLWFLQPYTSKRHAVIAGSVHGRHYWSKYRVNKKVDILYLRSNTLVPLKDPQGHHYYCSYCFMTIVSCEKLWLMLRKTLWLICVRFNFMEEFLKIKRPKMEGLMEAGKGTSLEVMTATAL